MSSSRRREAVVEALAMAAVQARTERDRDSESLGWKETQNAAK